MNPAKAEKMMVTAEKVMVFCSTEAGVGESTPASPAY